MRPPEYEAAPGFTQSDAKLLLKSPAIFKHRQGRRNEPTHAMDLGSLIDAMLFEQPLDWCSIKTQNWTTKAGKVEQAAFLENGWTAFTRDEWRWAQQTTDAVKAHPEAGPLVEGGRYQVSLYGTDAVTGLPIKGLLDCLQPGVIVDGKKAADASKWEFARQAGKLGYAIQAAAYLDLAAQNDLNATRFVHVVYELEPPHRVAVYELDEDSLSYGRRRWREALDLYARCIETDTWPDFHPEQGPWLRLPEYLLDEPLELIL